MYRLARNSICIVSCAMLLSVACAKRQNQTVEIKHYPLDSLEGIITTSGVSLDTSISSDKKGSLRITADSPVTVRLFETGDISIDYARLIYQARLRTENVTGEVYLEMWCRFPG